MTKPHNDRIQQAGEDHGYSLRVGKKLPPGSVNLAYVHTDEMAPKKNLLITDMSNRIVENKVAAVSDQLVYPDDTFLLRELDKPFYSTTKNVMVTDEFYVPKTTQESPVPLYFKAEARGLFDARGAVVDYYGSGYLESPPASPLDYSQVDAAKSDTLLYLGDRIRLTNLDGTALSSDKKYKIQLVKQTGAGIPANAYKIIIFTNFRGDSQNTYQLRYEYYSLDGTHNGDYTEILNAYPYFSEVPKAQLDTLAASPKTSGDWKTELQDKTYAIQETEDQKWQVFSPSQVLIADNTTRPAHQFSYRIKGNLRTKMSSVDAGSLNIGVVYLNQSIFAAEDLLGVVKKVYEHALKPPYLDFVNPHNPYVNKALSEQERADIKKSPTYWSIDLSMPADYLNDYDLIILTGYGNYDMSVYNDALRSYLSNGGRLWIDNGGSGSQVLKLQNFLINIGFSDTTNATGIKGYGIPLSQLNNYDLYSLELQCMNRLYVMDQTNLGLGTSGVNPEITFGAGEDPLLYTTLVKYTSNDLSVITRSIYGSGRLIVSNCGIFRSLMNKETDDIKFAMNIILTLAESKVVTTPWIQEYVYHRENLFKEEYRSGDVDIYVDDRSDQDSTQIVAKKILNKTVRDALIPYMPSSYYKAKGSFNVEVKADKQVVVSNNDFEVGTYNPATGGAVVSWATDTAIAIPGWSTKGTATFGHTSSLSERGSKAISIDSTNTAYWYTTVNQLTAGTYKMSAWVKVQDVLGLGAHIGIYKADTTQIVLSDYVAGTRDWVKVEVTFGVTTTTSIEMHIGFLDPSSNGKTWIDFVELVEVGSVYMTPSSDGDTSLYGYAIKPKGDTFDLKSQGFRNSDVTVYDPEIEINYTLRAFVYVWDNIAAKYIRQYGNYKTYTTKIRRSNGVMNLGLLTTLLPGLNAGAEWADKNRIFFEVFIGTPQGESDLSKFVNVGLFDTKTGHYFYSQSGENVIGYADLMAGTNSLTVILQAWTDYYTIRATKRRYAVKPQGDERIYLEYPSTIDNRDSWFVRVHNGSFVKNQLSFDEYDQFSSAYTNRSFGIHQFSLPEYDRQIFKPLQPFRRIRKEICEYVDDYTIRVQNTPLYVKQGKARGELLTSLDGAAKKIFKAQNGNWSLDFTPVVYADTNGNGVYIIVSSGYFIDPINGLVIFTSAASGNVKMDYNFNNLEVFKRSYGNEKVRRERLQSTDKKIFKSLHANWLMFPTPTVYRLPYGESNEKQHVAPVDTYTMDYDSGAVIFEEEVNDQVFADYTYSMDTKLNVRDYDIQNGLVYLQTAIDFKDEIYANYYYEEGFVHYRGFFDETLHRYVHLDLNPAEGHYCTLPVVRIDTVSGNMKVLSYDQVPTAKLMNKEVYLYVVPYRDSFGNVRSDCIRHCYSKAEWNQIQSVMPGIAQLLGVIQLREHTQIEKTTVLDTRVRGGGLKANISREMMKNNDPNSLSYWDVGPWDGMAYYKNGVIVIQIPKSVLKSNGGQFSEKEVTDIVKKYVAFGVYPIIEYKEDEAFATLPGVQTKKTMFIQGASFPVTFKN